MDEDRQEVFDALCERFRIQIAGRCIREGWFEPLAWDEEAVGTHVVHTGGQYDSWIDIAVIPPRCQAGEYTRRQACVASGQQDTYEEGPLPPGGGPSYVCAAGCRVSC